jgi:hypothetical protein
MSYPALSDSIVSRHLNILVLLTDKNINKHPIDFLLNHGKLYFGNLNKLFFKKWYQANKTINLDYLLNCQNLKSQDERQSVRFIQHMLRRGQQETWNLPGLITELDNRELFFGCGNSRLFVSGMCFSEPWKTINFLILQHSQTPADYYLENPIPILNIIDLHQTLNIPTEPTESPSTQLALSLLPKNNHFHIVLSNIKDHDPDDHQTVGQDYFDNFVKWQNINGVCPKLKIYTDWPDHIVDQNKTWDVEIAGPSVFYKEKLLGYGQLEMFLYHKNNSTREDCHCLFVLSDRKIDLSDLFFWVDHKHSAFVEHNLDFVLFKAQPQYLATRINVSRVVE